MARALLLLLLLLAPKYPSFRGLTELCKDAWLQVSFLPSLSGLRMYVHTSCGEVFSTSVLDGLCSSRGIET